MKRSPFICIFFVIFLFGMVACEDPNPSSAYPADKAYNLNVPSYFPKPIIPADNPLTENKVLLGRMLFYDPILSLDSTVSCASCHEQQFAFGDNKALSKKVGHGSTKRNSSVLFNLAFTNSFFWDGRTNTLEATCLDALIDEQQFDFKFVKPRIEKRNEYKRLFGTVYKTENITEDQIIKALATFIRTMVSANSTLDKGKKEGNPEKYLSVAARKGKTLFEDEDADCFHCHGGGNNWLFTDNQMRNNGLDLTNNLFGFKDFGFGGFSKNSQDNGKFKTASLRNLSYSGPFMHDGRFATIDEVIQHYSVGVKESPSLDVLMEFSKQGGVNLSPSEAFELKSFLLSLDDPDFIKDPQFSNPFK